jgi:hypothetical protein
LRAPAFAVVDAQQAGLGRCHPGQRIEPEVGRARCRLERKAARGVSLKAIKRGALRAVVAATRLWASMWTRIGCAGIKFRSLLEIWPRVYFA